MHISRLINQIPKDAARSFLGYIPINTGPTSKEKLNNPPEMMVNTSRNTRPYLTPHPRYKRCFENLVGRAQKTRINRFPTITYITRKHRYGDQWTTIHIKQTFQNNRNVFITSRPKRSAISNTNKITSNNLWTLHHSKQALTSNIIESRANLKKRNIPNKPRPTDRFINDLVE